MDEQLKTEDKRAPLAEEIDELIKVLEDEGRESGEVTYELVGDVFKEFRLKPAHIKYIVEELMKADIAIVEGIGDTEDVGLEEEEEEEKPELDLSVPEGVGIDDPVRM